ncbi:hypothetical protein ACP4OV_002121 [Aristida adscensionis]
MNPLMEISWGGEVIQAVSFANSVACKVFDVIKRHGSLKTDVKRGLEYIGREMKMMISEIKLKEERSQGVTHEIKIVLLKELAYEIEDFIDTTWVPSGAAGLVSSVFGTDRRPQILKKIDDFKTRIQCVREWQPDAAGSGGHGGDGGAAGWAPALTYSPEAALVGICKHRDELGKMLGGEEREELKVISIVGCRGVGKTALARVVYDHCRDYGGYDCVAWVVASDCRDPEDLLRKVLEEARRTAQSSGEAAQGSTSGIVQTSLRSFLRGKRYFIVIDDVDCPEVWQAIKQEFPGESHNSSTIIVTTSVHSVAAECSWGSHVYTMQCLDKDESEEVFWRTVGPEIRSPALHGASEGILKKCGGLPLALISVANYLRRRGQAERCVAGGIKMEHCKGAAHALGHKILEGQDAEFKELNRAVLQCYNKLPDYVHQSCLLYASMFPRGHPINCELLFRRWMAEGLVVAKDTITGEDGAKGCLEEFIDRCIIEPVEINNARITRCRVHSIMLEFIIHKAVSKSFFALVDNDELLSNKGSILDVHVRRLSIQDSSKKGVDDAAKNMDFSVMRSLAIFRSPLLDLQTCKLLRVLDLQGCKGFNNDDTVFRAICKQRFLKYLSLRGADVVKLHSEIRCLKRLETLDIRDTGVEDLPIEVMSLPLLAHLFGRFKLAHGIKEEMSKKSRLQTLAGVIIAKADQSFENIILHAPNLRKVKIYQTKSDSSNMIYQTASDSSNMIYQTASDTSNRCPNNTRLKLCRHVGYSGGVLFSNSPMLQIKERFTGSKALQVLSIDSSDFSTDFVSLLEPPCAITSIKLRGKLKGLPDTTTLSQLLCLNKLLLISSGLSSQDLSVLQILPCLEYLKLAEDHNGFRGGSFVVESGGFPSLKRLCFEAPKLPEVQFQEGSMKSLTILDLLCPHPDFPKPRPNMYFTSFYQVRDPIPMESRIGVAGVSYAENLNEVILHHSTGELKMQAWKEEVMGHKNRPSVKRQPKPIIHMAWS